MNDLSEGFAVLEFSGPDAVRYLNGQVTQDVRKAEEGGLLPSCVTDAKGRLQFRVWLARRGDSVLVFCRENLKEAVEARLTRYLIADDVEVCDVSGEIDVINHEFPDEWSDEADRIHRGIPKWGEELREGMLLQEAGLDETDVSFHKGCYVGQEVISRIKSAGKVNRRLVMFRFEGDARTGELWDEAEKVCGEVTSASGREGLGYLRRGVGSERFHMGTNKDVGVFLR